MEKSIWAKAPVFGCFQKEIGSSCTFEDQRAHFGRAGVLSVSVGGCHGVSNAC